MNHLSPVRPAVYIHERTRTERFWSGSSHVAHLLQPVAAADVRQGEVELAALLPAAADPPEPPGHAGGQEGQAAQQDRGGKSQDQHEGGGHQEAVLGRVEGAVPAVEERVDGGRGQGAVTQCGLQEAKQGGHQNNRPVR